MPDFSAVAEGLHQELEANPRIAAAGIFGSVSERDTWERSDIDLFVITADENDHWEGVYLRRQGIVVHLQTLSLAVLRKNAAVNKGGPFFTALADVTVWFDHSGDLATAVATAQAFMAPATRFRACREFCPGIESLHLAEKYAVKGKPTDARAALTIALGRLASARLADAGTYPPRDVWASPGTASLPEHEIIQQVWAIADTDLPDLIERVWQFWRPLLGVYSSPITDAIRQEGPLSLPQLGNADRLRGIDVPERLLDKLVEQGFLSELGRSHEGLGLRETCYVVSSGN